MHFEESLFSFLVWKSCLQNTNVLEVTVSPPREERKVGVRNVEGVAQWLGYGPLTCWVWRSPLLPHPWEGTDHPLRWRPSSTSSLFCLAQEMGESRRGGGTCSPVFVGGWGYSLCPCAGKTPATPSPQLRGLRSRVAMSCRSARELVPPRLRQLCSSPAGVLAPMT